MTSDDALASSAPVDRVLERAFEEPALVRALTSREELHAFANAFDWDDASVAALFEVIRHPLCDAGTAKAIYWLADPEALFEAGTRDEVESALRREHWDLLVEIEDALASGRFASAAIAFAPPLEEPTAAPSGRPIPRALYEPIEPG